MKQWLFLVNERSGLVRRSGGSGWERDGGIGVISCFPSQGRMNLSWKTNNMK